MKLQKLKNPGYKWFVTTVLCVLFIISSKQAYSQLDYYYGRNDRGIRLSAGVGFAILQTHFTENTVIANFVGNLDYNFNPYFSIGGEGQVGNLQGIDKKGHLPYSSSTNHYLTANLNFKVAVGLFYDFSAQNAWQDALKRLYIGAGIGGMKSKIELTQGTNPSIQPLNESPQTRNKDYVYPFDVGTNIELPGILGRDRLSINPDAQFTIIKSAYADGFRTPSTLNSNGYYSMYSIKLKYKF